MKTNSPQESFQRYSAKYQSASRVATYDTRWFTSLKGRVFTTAERRALRKAFSRIEPGQDVLDMPCGTGRITSMLLELGFRVTGADISEEMLACARNKLGAHPNLVGLQRADSTHLTFVDGAFSNAVCVRYLGDIPPEYQQRVLAEMARTTRGTVVAAFSRDSGTNRLRRKFKALMHSSMSEFPISQDSIKKWAHESGLEIVAEYQPLGPLSEELIVVFRHRDKFTRKPS